ncbi:MULTISPECIES: SSI family serine proteinase inhibitor [Streptosporangium]|uniref:Subtilisin inhibitor domain-containing protein n=1 Tax=Streptosporangium brasiliense TaxID=47480 RepID=A0ABT9R7S5_9ACTN|nr:SSI family serine proteinase inhibitor [Streptosporangium brasiliense]MDP9865293.1 hypothetical protein [Streptosporangium brasiliense]
MPVRPIAQLLPPGSTKAFVLSIAEGENSAAAARHVLLVCDPPYGTHPTPVAACEALAQVGGDIARLRPLPNLVCAMAYDPITVTATGIWDGRSIRYEQTFGNACSLRGTTGLIFS